MRLTAYVKAVGQIELLFSFIVTYFYFKEKISRIEFVGTLLIAMGILVFVLY